ncbi:HNH endonuclease signature motif containing protein [Arthrobacter glacialis]|uniref:HNH nuclease domain-containing protein n=1 Tax=Arthrobacter glacialis TaxID=1664 RepID=A0A2S3ZWY7_ARTGL|nr:HNH endonuclease signature motif containing protein [Arthrobacter glacialis]POH73781.1 hypothetical protein CVS27_07580 [Arthrobacter glacialis]
MSWLSLYAPAATIEGIWDQCTLTAQAAQGPHEPRTLTQLRADVAAALLLNQSLSRNNIHTPPTPTSGTPYSDGWGATAAGNADVHGSSLGNSQDCGQATDSSADMGFPSTAVRVPETSPIAEPRFIQIETDPCAGAPFPDTDTGRYRIPGTSIPVFEDPDYQDPGFKDPDDRSHPDWHPNATPPPLIPATATATEADRTAYPPRVDDAQWPSGINDAADYCGIDGPPMPRATVLVTVPALSLLGHINAPAVLEGYGPISVEVANRLLAGSTSFYRVLTDPISNEPLDLAPDTYRVGKAMRFMLRGRDHYCQFPGCTAKASLAELDHILPWESGGKTAAGNLEFLCKRHHLAKHFKDGKTRSGQVREQQRPERRALKLRGWTAVMTESGRPGWISPSGRYHPPQPLETQPASYPKWLKKNIQQRLDGLGWDEDPFSQLNENEIMAMDFEEDYGTHPLPEPPDWAFPDNHEAQQQCNEQAAQRDLNGPHEE